MKRFTGLLLSLTLSMGIFAGCTSAPAANSATTSSETTSSESQASASGTTAVETGTWPRTIEDSLGNKITLKEKPKRVAIMDFGFMDTMFALGITPAASTMAERSLNGFGTLQPYAADVKIEELGDAKAPNLEKLVELAPDLILTTAEEGHFSDMKYDETAQIANIVAFDVSKMTWQEQLRAFAECLGTEKEAEAYITDVETTITESQNKLSAYRDKTSIFLFDTRKSGFSTMGGTKAHPEWFDKSIGLGLTAPESYDAGSTLSLEGLAQMNPDYIFIAGSLGTKETNYKQSYVSEDIQNSTVWKSLKAVKNGHVYNLDASVRAGGPLAVKLGIETIVKDVTESK